MPVKIRISYGFIRETNSIFFGVLCRILIVNHLKMNFRNVQYICDRL